MSKYRVRSSRTSSASRDSESVVNPTRSANRIDTRRRSALGRSRGVAARIVAVTGAAAPAGLSATGAPHSSQNLAPEATGWPLGQTAASPAPQLLQNLASVRFSVPQFAQI